MRVRMVVSSAFTLLGPALLTVLGMVLLTLMVTPSLARADMEKYVDRFEQTEKLAADGKVLLTNISGNVEVQTWDRSEVKIDARKISTASSLEKAEQNAAEVSIDVERRNGLLKIETKYPEGKTYKKNINVSVEYTLTIPARANVTVVTVSGSITAKDLGGLAKLNAVSGNVHVTNATKGGVFGAVSGNVELRDIRGDVEVKNVSGSIELDNVEGDVDVETVSGDVDVTDLSDAESVDINVHSGSITFDGVLNPEGRYSLETFSGPITVRLPKNSAFDFTCKTFAGTITSDFKATVELQGQLKETAKKIRGQVNGGGADLTVETFSGTIRLQKRD